MWWVGAISMTWWVQDFSGLWICTEEFFGGRIGVLILPTIFSPGSSEMGKKGTNKRCGRERKRGGEKREEKKKMKKTKDLKVHCKRL
jgi:hypothetical protein